MARHRPRSRRIFADRLTVAFGHRQTAREVALDSREISEFSTHDAAHDERNRDILIHVNGQLVPREKAVVSVYDSGFLLGDGVWEGLRLHRGKWLFLEEHLDRLFEAAKAIDLDPGMDREIGRASCRERVSR